MHMRGAGVGVGGSGSGANPIRPTGAKPEGGMQTQRKSRRLFLEEGEMDA